MKPALTQRDAANANVDDPEVEVLEIAADPKQLVKLIAYGVFTGCVQAFQNVVARAPMELPALPRPAAGAPDPEKDILTADEVAAFLGVDRNTVYEYAGRGVIPHQRLGKRILFRRGALVSWLDASCKATSTRKG